MTSDTHYTDSYTHTHNHTNTSAHSHHHSHTQSNLEDQQHYCRVIKYTTQEIITDEDPVTIIHPAAMSETTRNLTSPAAGKNPEQTAKSSPRPGAEAPRTPSQKADPLVPRSVASESQSHLGDVYEEGESQPPESSGGDDGEGEMVPAAGRINEKGEVIDDDGNAIGRITSGDPGKLAGFVVTQEGDVLDEDGRVVGKAEPLEDVASELNYTTSQQQQQEKNIQVYASRRLVITPSPYRIISMRLDAPQTKTKRTLVLPSRKSSFMPFLTNSGCEMNSATIRM